MILSVHLLETSSREALSLLRAAPQPADAPGLVWGTTTLALPLAAPKPPRLTGAALVAGWRDDAALDGFLADHPVARRFAGGWHVRLQPLRAYGEIAEWPGLGRPEQPTDPEEPVVVLTFGRTKLHRLPSFLRASAPAERQAVDHPAVLLSTALARPPRIVGTFSVWRTAAAMREYAVGTAEGADRHVAAMRANAARPFHREQLFARFRPTAVSGRWQGAQPLAVAAAGSVPAAF
ncbi:MAG TPA: hypothetical protein VFR97_00235 [Capillimicrobium sp.]|nr:hypothetical protein [Capillimicrobium sp.]